MQGKYKNLIERRSPCRLKTAVIEEFFSFINFMFITQKSENESAPIDLETQRKFFIFKHQVNNSKAKK